MAPTTQDLQKLVASLQGIKKEGCADMFCGKVMEPMATDDTVPKLSFKGRQPSTKEGICKYLVRTPYPWKVQYLS